MKKVCILGTAPLSRLRAPFADQSYDIWVCSAGNMNGMGRITAWFELHAMVELTAEENRGWADGYFPWLRAQTFPVYMQEANNVLVPQALYFPWKELIAYFNTDEWWTSSIAWMIGFAIYNKYDEIAIFGVDMAAEFEHYTAQRPGCRRLIEIARERGLKVSIPWESCLGAPAPIYGYSEQTPFARRMNVTEEQVNRRRQEIDQQVERTRLEKAFFDGAAEQLRYIKRTWFNGRDAILDNTAIDGLADAAKTYAQNVTLESNFAPSAGGVLVPVGSNGHAQPDPQTAAAVEKAYKRKQAGLPA